MLHIVHFNEIMLMPSGRQFLQFNLGGLLSHVPSGIALSLLGPHTVHALKNMPINEVYGKVSLSFIILQSVFRITFKL